MKPKILVIDDEEILTKTFAKLLEKKGYEVLVASRGEDALAMAEEINFDMVLCDIRMPGQNGVETAKQIRALCRNQGKENIPIIFLTGYADEQLENEARELEPVATIFKPFDASQLMELINTTVGTK